MSRELYNNLKANILGEFKKVSAILENCDLTTPKAFPEPLMIDSGWLLNTDDKELNSFLKQHFTGLTKDVIYKIELLNVSNKEEVISSFLKAKENKTEGRAYSKYNKENIECFNKENHDIVLYIGSSKGKGIVTRMRCHMGVGAKKTYGIHLKTWLPKTQKCNVKITLFELSYPPDGNQRTNMLELIEQALWNSEKPLLGKKSGLL